MADEIQNHAAGNSGTPIEATQQFFDRLDASAALPPNLSPVDAASSVLCALSLRLPAAEAQALIKSLPTSLRALFTLCVRHRGEAPVSMELGEFLALVADHLQVTETEARRIALAVFAAIAEELPAAEVTEVATQLPTELRTLWPHREAA